MFVEPLSSELLTFYRAQLARAAAHRHAVQAQAAGAAAGHHRHHAFAALLAHVAATRVTARAGEAAAIGRHLTFTHTHVHVAAHHHHAVHHHAAGKH